MSNGSKMSSSVSSCSKSALKVAIIGAGVCGMSTARVCLEVSPLIEFVVFERGCHIGGLWRFNTDVVPGTGAVMHSTIVNSSKEMSAFSDFPVPAELPNFMHNRDMYQYLLDYAESFDFQKYVRFEHEVTSIELTAGLDQTGYEITVRNLQTNQSEVCHFDAVAVCIGHNHTPKWPNFAGQDQFMGKVMHTHAVRHTEEFRGKTVVVVGVGNSSGDVAADIAPIAKQVYLSSRRGGTWLIRRTGLNGFPIDTLVQRRLHEATMDLLPYRVKCFLVESVMKKAIGHQLIGLMPKNTRFYSQHVMVNDLLTTAIHLGQVKMREDIERFTPTGVIFEGDNGEETRCDVVVFGTGYQLSYPFLSKSLVNWSDSGRINLYKHVFDPELPNPKTFAFIGMTQPIGSAPPIAEIQARWWVALLTNQCKPLPSKKAMRREIQQRTQRIKRRYGAENCDRMTFQVDWLPYMDCVARSAGFKPSLAKYFFTDIRLWWALCTQPAIPAQFRLQGPNAKPEQARKLILTIEDRIKAPYKKSKNNTKTRSHEESEESQPLTSKLE